ncbi:Protein of unknown function [Pyronema omphalodes CBS 100304]|uniref:Uncharacterized protein n=1 Tax=Pyronema omphalodes (strain CBS 100304) TaxID=1076935 RepID=U4L2A6_PYROM|nr:Protein of unknown function [Pyronema omphalodes CBS 100304]
MPSAHPAFFPEAFKSQPLLGLDSGTASVRSVASSKYSLHDLDYDPYAENAITPDPFPSAYEFDFARNARSREFEGGSQSPLFSVSSVSLDDGCGALQPPLSNVEEQENPTPPRDHLPTDREEIRKLAMEGRRRTLVRFGEDPDKPLAVPHQVIHSRIDLPSHLNKHKMQRSQSSNTQFGIRRRIADTLEHRNTCNVPTQAAGSFSEEAPASATTPSTETSTLGLLRRGTKRVKRIFKFSKPTNGNDD